MCFSNDSKEFQGKESTCIGKLSHVPSQPAVVLSPPAIRALRFDTWNLSGTQGNFFGQYTCSNRFITDTLSRNSSLMESKCYRKQRENSVRDSTGRPLAKSEAQNRGTIPLPSFARRPSTMNSCFLAEGPRNCTADQQKL